MWCHGVVGITTAQLHSTKPELRFCTGSNPACDVSEIHNGEDLWSQLEIRLIAFCWSTNLQKKFIIIIILWLIPQMFTLIAKNYTFGPNWGIFWALLQAKFLIWALLSISKGQLRAFLLTFNVPRYITCILSQS